MPVGGVFDGIRLRIGFSRRSTAANRRRRNADRRTDTKLPSPLTPRRGTVHPRCPRRAMPHPACAPRPCLA